MSFIGDKPHYKRQANFLAHRVHQARKDAGLTITQLANRMGVRRSLIHNHERNDCCMNVLTYLRMCDAIGVKPEELIKNLTPK